MKKFASLLLAMLMVVSMAACGTSESGTSNPPAETPTPANSAEPQGGKEPAPAPGNDKLVVGFAQIGQESGWRDAETNDIQWYAARNTDTVELPLR